jgi:hypothetical protein
MARAKKTDVDQFHVHCKLPNASTEISGVTFVAHADGVRTADPVGVDVASRFKGIPGFMIVDHKPGKAEQAPEDEIEPPPPAETDETPPPGGDELKF